MLSKPKPTASNANDAAQAKALCDFESEVCDLMNMARLAADAVESILIQDSSDITGNKDFVYCQKETAETCLFAVYQMQKMAEGFHDKYLDALRNTD